MRDLPEGLTPYKRTPVFHADTVPAALLQDHATKAGVWGLIHVTSGELIYRIKETGEEVRLAPGVLGVVEPETLHSVRLVGAVSFFVELWRCT